MLCRLNLRFFMKGIDFTEIFPKILHPTCLHSKRYEAQPDHVGISSRHISNFRTLPDSIVVFCHGFFCLQILVSICSINHLFNYGKKPSSQKRTFSKYRFFATQVRIFTWFTSDFTAVTTSPKDLQWMLMRMEKLQANFCWLVPGAWFVGTSVNSLHMTGKLASISSNSGGVGDTKATSEKMDPYQTFESIIRHHFNRRLNTYTWTGWKRILQL